jgi:hypothetical protein
VSPSRQHQKRKEKRITTINFSMEGAKIKELHVISFSGTSVVIGT